jgi:methyl-accepting chemotaxis protein
MGITARGRGTQNSSSGEAGQGEAAKGAGTAAGPAGHGGGADEFLAEVAKQANRLSTEIVDVSGHIDALSATLQRQVKSFAGLGDSASAMGTMLAAIHRAAKDTDSRLTATGVRVREARSTAEGGIRQIAELVDAVKAMGEELNSFGAALQGVAGITEKVGRIAEQTNLLALNATIEAARAGAHGVGFAVVAREVKELSRQTSRDTSQISDAVKNLGERAAGLLQQGKRAIGQASDARASAGLWGDVLDVADAAMREACSTSHQIVERANEAEGKVESVHASLSSLTEEVARSATGLEDARNRTSALIEVGEKLVEITIASGADTPDAPFVRLVVETADRISKAFDEAVAKGRITAAALLSRKLAPIPGTNPAQFMAEFTEFTDSLMPAFQEPMLSADPRIVFCVAVNEDGYLPTHNKKYSQPQGSDPVWNAANCRNRRVFNDRVGLAAGRNRRPYLVQTYRRDMGGGNFVMMKDVSAPIRAGGRHWGGLRLAYKV